MGKIFYFTGAGDVSQLGSVYKLAAIRFASGTLMPLPLTKRFSEGEEKKGYEQLKRWVSSAAFSLIVLDGFGDAFSAMDKADVVKWLTEHEDEPDFPLLLITGKAVEGLEYKTISSVEELLNR